MSKDNLYIKRNKGLGGKSKTIILVSILILSIALVVFLGILVFGSGDDGEGKTIGKLFSSDKNGTSSNEKGNNGNSTEEPEATQEPYAPIVEDAVTVGTRFNPPEGYERVELEEGSFGEYLRNYALKPYGTVAFLYDDSTGSYIENTEASTVGVFQQPNALNRWQQCADSIAMLYAEYLYENQQYDKITFTFSNGFVCDWLTYAQGNRFDLNTSSWVMKAEPDDSYETFQRYLDLVYQFLNTDSLQKDMSVTPAAGDIAVGDAFVVGVSQLSAAVAAVDPGATVSYGHAIIVVDVAVNENGEKIFMIAEGNTPATEIAIIENSDPEMGVWFKFNDVGSFVKSSETGVPWSAAWLRRFPE